MAECPVGDKIGSPVQGEAGVSLTQRSTQAHAAQGSVTLGPEQGEVGANFSHLGNQRIDRTFTIWITKLVTLCVLCCSAHRSP